VEKELIFPQRLFSLFILGKLMDRSGIPSFRT
jgi:hypothetical protein